MAEPQAAGAARRGRRMRDFRRPMSADNARQPRIASYQADPDEVGRVLLLYSGGLDTTVMLHWIQDRYEAEVVTLTVNLGQPGEDWEVVVGKARDLGAVDAIVVDAREEFAADYVAAGDQGQRALRRRLSALHRARPAADREARGRARARPPAATRSPTAAPARATTRCASRRRSRRSIRS